MSITAKETKIIIYGGIAYAISIQLSYYLLTILPIESYYAPSAAKAFASVEFITRELSWQEYFTAHENLWVYLCSFIFSITLIKYIIKNLDDKSKLIKVSLIIFYINLILVYLLRFSYGIIAILDISELLSLINSRFYSWTIIETVIINFIPVGIFLLVAVVAQLSIKSQTQKISNQKTFGTVTFWYY